MQFTSLKDSSSFVTLAGVNEDDWIRERRERHAIWVAVLTDGSSVISDDHRPHIEPHSAWIRLKNFLSNERLWIDKIFVQFRKHKKLAASDSDLFFFSKSALGIWGLEESINHFLFGELRPHGYLRVRKFQVPELVEQSVEKRDPNNVGEECLIRKNES